MTRRLLRSYILGARMLHYLIAKSIISFTIAKCRLQGAILAYIIHYSTLNSQVKEVKILHNAMN